MAAAQEEFLHATFDKTVTLGTEKATLKGKFLFCWPYVWEESTNWDVIHKATETVTNWARTCFPQESVSLQLVRSSVIFSYNSCPSYWRQKPEEPSIYAKLILYSKAMHLLFQIDDTSEAEVEPARNFIDLFHDCAMDLKVNFGVTKELGQYFARSAAYCFIMQTWCDDKDQTFLLNLYTQYHLRIFPGGTNSMEELIFLLQRIYVPASVRTQIRSGIDAIKFTGFLTVRTNDVIATEKEWQDKVRIGTRVDNIVFHYMEATNYSFEEAVSRAITEHNFALKEFYDFFEYFKINQD
ncbi:unnamed protein product [Allacma fusca]|uniref:Terpenoid synthase n=1 Tax=Allacma fusca TaxID=39272 RepID=A0A8J2KYP7_9HEXA|nr:unnamed protein product [Allacma fusca]